jgi:hypothetical protein
MSFPWVAILRIKAMNSQMSTFQNDQIPNHRPLKTYHGSYFPENRLFTVLRAAQAAISI